MLAYWSGHSVVLPNFTGLVIAARALVFLSLLAILGIFAQPHAALAEDSVGTGNGDLFHSKGWIRPEIYRKAAKASDQNAPTNSRSVGTKRKTNLAQTTRRSQKRSKRSQQTVRRSSSKLRTAARSPIRKQRAAAAKSRRVPPRHARRLEHRPNSSNDPLKYAIKVASLGIDLLTVPKARFGEASQDSVTGGGLRIRWVASKACLTKRLQAAIQHVALNFGRVRVNSTCRSRRHNRRVGGARRSWHLKGRAADIRVFGNIRKAARYLRRVVGGYKHYGGGLFHIDTGPRRRW